MPLMLMVEMTSHEEVRMIAVGNRFMPAVRAVPVGGFVTAAGASSIAFRRIGGIDFQLVFVHMVAMHIVHVAVVKKTLMPIVHESRVAALSSMLVGVSLVNLMSHKLALLCSAMLNLSRRSQKKCGRKWRPKCHSSVSYDLLRPFVAEGTRGYVFTCNATEGDADWGTLASAAARQLADP